MSSTFGHLFRVTTFGESHGRALGAVVEGCPPGLALSDADIQPQLNRRRPGQSGLTTPRAEQDRIAILSGVEGGRTLGGPIAMMVQNLDMRPVDYWEQPEAPRPSHADYTYHLKYGLTASSGGGRASARETLARVAAGTVAEKMLSEMFGISIVAWVSAVGSVKAPEIDDPGLTREKVDSSPVRCPDPALCARMAEVIEEAKKDHDSIGGIVSCVCRESGGGRPVFDKPPLFAHDVLTVGCARF